ncbi:MAG: signal peptidase [Thermoleophilaceae bacterium]|nr:signal peptidase [Thermoleophilaceae bacterium]
MESTAAIAFDPAPSVGGSSTLEADATQVKARRRLGLQTLRRGAALASLMAVAGGIAYLGVWPPLATVMSGSMSPTISTGDVVVIRHLGRAPRLGDILAITVPEAARSRYGYPPEVVHRVFRIARDGKITTKGDARPRPDPFTIGRSSIKGEVVATIPAGGRVLSFLTSTLGLIWLAGGALVLLVLPRLDRQREFRESESAHAAGLESSLQEISDQLAELRRQANERAAADGQTLDSLRRETLEAREQLNAVRELVAAQQQQPQGRRRRRIG